MLSSTPNCWMYYLATSGSWRASKNLLCSQYAPPPPPPPSPPPPSSTQVILHDPIYTLYVTYTDTGIIGHIFIKFHARWFQGTPVVSFLFIQHIIANINVFTIWWKTTFPEAVLYGGWCYLSPGFCNEVKSYEEIDRHFGSITKEFSIFRFLIPVVFYANEGGWVRQNTTVVGSYLLVRWWWHVSAVLGHLQVIN